MVLPVRIERTTLCLEGRCSIQLSYESIIKLVVGEGIEPSTYPL